MDILLLFTLRCRFHLTAKRVWTELNVLYVLPYLNHWSTQGKMKKHTGRLSKDFFSSISGEQLSEERLTLIKLVLRTSTKKISWLKAHWRYFVFSSWLMNGEIEMLLPCTVTHSHILFNLNGRQSKEVDHCIDVWPQFPCSIVLSMKTCKF